MTSEYTIRGATVEDVEMIMHQRSAMFIDMGVDEALVRRWEAPFGVWVRKRLASGAYRGWLAVDAGGAVVAGAGLWIHEWVPSPLLGKPVRGYILNVYTEPDRPTAGAGGAAGGSDAGLLPGAGNRNGGAERQRSGTPDLRGDGLQGHGGDAAEAGVERVQ